MLTSDPLWAIGSFVSAALQLLFRMSTCRNNSSHLPGIRSSPVDHMSHKILQIQFDLPKTLCSLVLLKVLSSCIMVKSICPTIFINILCHYHFNMLRMPAILNQILEFILPAQTSFWTGAGSRPIKLPSIVPLSLSNLSILNQSVTSDHLIRKS